MVIILKSVCKHIHLQYPFSELLPIEFSTCLEDMNGGRMLLLCFRIYVLTKKNCFWWRWCVVLAILLETDSSAVLQSCLKYSLLCERGIFSLLGKWKEVAKGVSNVNPRIIHWCDVRKILFLSEKVRWVTYGKPMSSKSKSKTK